VLAVPALVGIGRVAEARTAAAGPAPVALLRFAEGTLAAGEPEVALPLLIEAAESLERGAPAVVLPDTPHAIGAVVAVAAGDVASAEHLLTRACAARIGGPVAEERHRLLLAWARMRRGRYDTALHELRRPAGADPPGRERLLRAALAAGIARRRGDIAGLRDVWSGIEPLLARRTVDLWQIEAVEELAVAGARLRRAGRVEPVLDLLDGIVARLDEPATWSVSLGWLRLQMAIVSDDAAAAAEVAERLAAVVDRGARALAQCTAAARWAEVLADRVAPDAVLRATEDLHAAQLPWEASRLAGQAAIRTAAPAAARRLLERARELSEPESAGPADPVAGAAAGAGRPADRTGGLSEREVTVARLVLAGSTHREIGAQLYIAPKTVEHHVARIRSKLGANTRAELMAMLREMLGD
jgi:DNA-binding NarL/FixJ family response regulator